MTRRDVFIAVPSSENVDAEKQYKRWHRCKKKKKNGVVVFRSCNGRFFLIKIRIFWEGRKAVGLLLFFSWKLVRLMRHFKLDLCGDWNKCPDGFWEIKNGGIFVRLWGIEEKCICLQIRNALLGQRYWKIRRTIKSICINTGIII